jgi:hybrid cluster-associated redox disulfide protein
MAITKDMTVNEVVQRFPETAQVFSRHGVACVSCSAAQEDSVEQSATIHGLDAQQLVAELNAAILSRP